MPTKIRVSFMKLRSTLEPCLVSTLQPYMVFTWTKDTFASVLVTFVSSKTLSHAPHPCFSQRLKHHCFPKLIHSEQNLLRVKKACRVSGHLFSQSLPYRHLHPEHPLGARGMNLQACFLFFKVASLQDWYLSCLGFASHNSAPLSLTVNILLQCQVHGVYNIGNNHYEMACCADFYSTCPCT